MTKEQFLARCSTAWDKGLVTNTALVVMDRWHDMIMRLQGGQWSIFMEMAEEEKHRTGSFNADLAGDSDGYKGTQFLAILRHPCQICAENKDAWHTRPGFCQHRGTSGSF